MTGVEQDRVPRRVEDQVQRHGQLDDTQVRAEMTATLGRLADQELPDVRRPAPSSPDRTSTAQLRPGAERSRSDRQRAGRSPVPGRWATQSRSSTLAPPGSWPASAAARWAGRGVGRKTAPAAGCDLALRRYRPAGPGDIGATVRRISSARVARKLADRWPRVLRAVRRPAGKVRGHENGCPRSGHPSAAATRQPIVVAHRGASAHVPENTVPAFEAAWNAGAQWVEADTQPTADGVPVILHDELLDRTTSGSGPIRAVPRR